MRILIDECLSLQLAQMAQVAGHEASHVVWLGLAGKADWELMPVILKGDWTFVTRNAFDFRGRADRPGGPGLHARVDIHAGLVCLSREVMTLSDQRTLFAAALDDLASDPDPINQVLEVVDDGSDDLILRRYGLPL